MTFDTHVVHTDLNYLIPDGFESAPQSVAVRNARRMPKESWQTLGFELFHFPSVVKNWDDDHAIAQLHYKELVEFAIEQTGADVATISGHIKRNPGEAAKHEDLGPITFVHSDFAPSYRQVIIDRHAEPDSLPDLVVGKKKASSEYPDLSQASRILILQFWRNLGPEKMDLPIAFCNPASIDTASLRFLPVEDYAGSGTFFETIGIESNKVDNHDWRYFSEMNQDEMVVFRTFDTARQAEDLPDWTPHSAFRDPAVELGAPARSSIECRVHCFFFDE